jgi:DNA-binding NarL/FixJ family response regulator
VSRPRLILADADAPTRAGLRIAVESAGLTVIGEAGNAEAAIEAILRINPELAVVAADLPGGGTEVLVRVSALRPGVRLVLLTASPSGEELLAAVLAGASGYLTRAVDPARLPAALKGVLAGEVALPRRHSGHLLDALRARTAQRAPVSARARAELTGREWEVLELLGNGERTAEMARRLGISEVTVRRHISTVVAKLGVPDRRAAAALMRERSAI